MDWQSVLTALWGKVSKPLPNFLIGGVFIFLAPSNIAWTGYIFIALGISGVWDWLNPQINHWWRIQQVKKAVEKYIPHMTEKDKEIIGYLLNKNQKVFTGNQDGGYASTLIAAGVIVYAHRHGQIMHLDDVPFAITDEAWEVLQKNKDQFSYSGADDAPHPWRIGWMERI
jgi:Super-infection exclusion protein B